MNESKDTEERKNPETVVCKPTEGPCLSFFCPSSHRLEDISCYGLWSEEGIRIDHSREGEVAQRYAERLETERGEIVEHFNRRPGADRHDRFDARIYGLESLLRRIGRERFSNWLQRGRERGWLLYRQNPESYTLVSEEDLSNKSVEKRADKEDVNEELLFRITHANWEKIKGDLSHSQLQWVGRTAIKMLSRVLEIGAGRRTDEYTSTAWPAAIALERVIGEQQDRQVRCTP